jgi:hypothetical protein
VNARGRISTLTLVLPLLAFAGCGGDGEGEGSHAKTAGGRATTTPAPALSSPIRPRCKFRAFRHPTVQRTIGPGGGHGWQVSYLPPALSRVRPGQTTNVLIVEQSPALPASGVEGGQTIIVAGRRVSFRTPAAKTGTFLAEFKTKRARYTVLANGDRPTTLKKFIACLP